MTTIHRLLLVTALLFIAHSSAFAQNSSPKALAEGIPFTSVTIDQNTPAWAKSLYAENPNIYQIEKQYAIWRKANPTIKNGHTRNFKHFYNYLVSKDAINQDGTVKNDFEAISFDKKKNWEKQRSKHLKENNQSAIRSSNNTDWNSLGPFMMYQNGSRANIQANMYAIAQAPSNENIVYASSEAGATIFKSIDQGDNWISPNDNLSFSGPRELEVHPSDPETVYLGSQHDIYKTTDGALTWNSVYYNWNNASNAIIINPSNSNTVIASGNERMLRSTNAGSSWTEVWTGKTYDVKFKPGDPQTVYALMDNTSTLQTDFYKSTNGGVNWTKITNGWPNETSTGNKGGRMTVSDGNPNIILCFYRRRLDSGTDSERWNQGNEKHGFWNKLDDGIKL